MQSCSTEEAVLDNEANKKNYVTSEKVSIENVLSVLKNPVILNRTETFKTSTPESITQKSGEKPNVYFTKIVKGNEYTTYLLLLNSYSTKNPYFMYYVITQDATTEKVGYLKYLPDTAIPFIDINTFSGKIQILDLKKKIRTESILLNGQPKKQANAVTAKTAENCTITVIYIAHYCTNGGDHSLGESCGGNLINDAYNEYTSISEICTSSGYDNSAPVPNELMNLSNGIGGGGANTDVAVIAFVENLDLEQKNWWDNFRNAQIKEEIITFLTVKTIEGVIHPQILEFVRELINSMINNPVIRYTIDNFPGKNEGMSFEWWKNDDFIENSVLFNSDPYDVWNQLTKTEKLLIKTYPGQALIIFKNREIATNETQSRWGFNGRNDKSDAFRHAFYNAINTKYCGAAIVILFSTAHESEVPNNLSLEVSMDIHNNLAGINFTNGISLMTDQVISGNISDKILDGELRYLSPLDIVIPPNYGITPETRLTATNQ